MPAQLSVQDRAELPNDATRTSQTVRLARTAVDYLIDNQLSGDVVACGVGHGFAITEIASALQCHGDNQRDLHLYDKYWTSRECGYGTVRQRLSASRYPADRVHFHQGNIADILSQGRPLHLAMLLLNVRHLPTTRRAIELLFPALTHNGVLLVESDHASIADYFRHSNIHFPLQLHQPRARIGINSITP